MPKDNDGIDDNDDNKGGDYTVGYSKPPIEHQFKPGQTGNVSGRPKGAKNLKTDLEEELRELIDIREGQSKKRISKQRGIIKSLVAKAIKGDVRASNATLALMLRLLFKDTEQDDEIDLSTEDIAIVDAFLARIDSQNDDEQDGRSESPDGAARE